MIDEQKMQYPSLMRAMEKEGITVRQIAAAVEMSVQTMKNKLSGIGQLSVTDAIAIQETFFKEYNIKKLFETDRDLKRREEARKEKSRWAHLL